MIPEHWPPLIINLKQIVTGERIGKYTVSVARLAAKYKQPLIVCVNNAEVGEAIRAIKDVGTELFDFLHIFGQSIDPIDPGTAATGRSLPAALKLLGAHGTLINHFEHRVYGRNPGKFEKTLGTVRDRPEDLSYLLEAVAVGLKADLCLVVCADQARTAAEIAENITSDDFKERIYDDFYSQLIGKLETESYVEFEKVFGRFPEGLSKGAFTRVDFPDTFFGTLTKEEAEQSHEKFKPCFDKYRQKLTDTLSPFLKNEMRQDLAPQVVERAYRRVAIAVEWDEFIGQGISIVRNKPEVVRESVQAVQKINPLLSVYCGAGVDSAEDVLLARNEYGAVGALAASAFAKPYRHISWYDSVEEFLKGL